MGFARGKQKKSMCASLNIGLIIIIRWNIHYTIEYIQVLLTSAVFYCRNSYMLFIWTMWILWMVRRWGFIAFGLKKKRARIYAAWWLLQIGQFTCALQTFLWDKSWWYCDCFTMDATQTTLYIWHTKRHFNLIMCIIIICESHLCRNGITFGIKLRINFQVKKIGQNLLREERRENSQPQKW